MRFPIRSTFRGTSTAGIPAEPVSRDLITKRKEILLLINKTMFFGVLLTCSAAVQAGYVLPQMGGGQVGMMGAPMKHTDVMFDGFDITLHVDDSVQTAVLRSLEAPDEFDPAQPWAVLREKAYNYQNAWNPGGFISLATGTAIWIERLAQDPALEVYLRPPAFTSGSTWPEIFTADGDRWKWSGAMQHNAYAVLNPQQSTYSASYRVYIGDATTGVPLPGYGSADVTWTWNATPTPEPASIVLLGAGGCAILLIRRRVTSKS
jgi:hypothetical protein